MRRPVRQCADFAKWTLVIAMVATTLLLVGGRFVVNQLSFYQPSIEDWLSQNLGIPLTTGRVVGNWQGVLPQISLESVEMGGDEPFLTMDSMELEPDYLRSFLHRTLVVHEMQVENLRMSFREDASGRWTLGELTGAGRMDAQSRRRLLDALTESQSIVVRNTQIDLVFFDGRRMQLAVELMTAQSEDDFHRIVAQASVASEANKINFIAEVDDSFDDGSGRVGAAYFKFSGTSLEEPLGAVIENFQSWNEQQGGDNSTTLDAEIWFDLFPDWTANYSGALAMEALPMDMGALGSGLLDYRANLVGSANYGGEIRIDFIDPVVELNSEELPLFDFSLRQRRGAESDLLSFATNSLALGSIYSQLVEHNLLSGRIAEVLAQLNPRGFVNNLLVDLDMQDPRGTLNIRGNLENVDLDAFIRAPSVDNLSGYFEAGVTQGFVQIDAENISPYYEGVYDQPFIHQHLTGIVAWEVDLERGAVEVFADNLRIQGAEGDIFGAFRVEAPLQRRAFPTDLSLEIGLANSSSAHRQRLVPKALPENIRVWIDESIGTAVVPAASFVYRGKLGGTRTERTIQLNLSMQRGELKFAPGWPELSRVDAKLVVDNSNVSVMASTAYLGDIDVSGAVVGVYPDSTTRITIGSAFRGPANQVLDLIRDTPVRNRVGSGLDVFNLDGILLGSVDLDFPLSGDFPIEELHANIEADFSGNTLNLEQRNLQIDELQGTLEYDQDGLHADSITGMLWSRPIELTVSTDEKVFLNLKTEAEVSDLANWLQAGWLEALHGVAGIEGRVEIGAVGTEQQSSYRFHSSLEGVTSTLPGPLAKSADESLQLEVANTYGSHGSILSLILGEQLEVSLVRDAEGSLQSASLGLNSPAPAAESGQFKGLVSLENLEVEEWTEWLSASSGDGGMPTLEPHIELSAQNTVMGGRSFGGVHALLNRQDEFWEIDFASVWGQGVYRFQSASGSTPGVPQLHLRALDLLAWQQAVGPSENTDPRNLPRLDLSIDELSFGERDFGRWEFQVNPTPDGVELLNISATRDDIRVVGAERATYLLWRYDGSEHFTQMDMSLEFGDASQLFELLNQPSPITSTTGSLYSSFAWAGRPTALLDQPLSGVLGVRLEEGQFDTQVEGVGNALMRVIGMFNINSWARRLQFDFSDVTSRGTSFDRVRGDFVLDEGILTTLTPVDARLSSGRMRFDGQVNLVENTVDAQLVATLPLRENMTWVTGLVAGLPAAAGVWLIGKLFESEVESLTSVSYRITGDLDDPDVKTERVFESTIGGG